MKKSDKRKLYPYPVAGRQSYLPLGILIRRQDCRLSTKRNNLSALCSARVSNKKEATGEGRFFVYFREEGNLRGECALAGAGRLAFNNVYGGLV